MTTPNKRSDIISADQAMIDGVQKFLAHLASMTVGSQTMTPADIVKVFQDSSRPPRGHYHRAPTARGALPAAV
jgi:hypothetical protein